MPEKSEHENTLRPSLPKAAAEPLKECALHLKRLTVLYIGSGAAGPAKSISIPSS